MQLYRSNLNNGGSGEDYSATYTATVNGDLQMGSASRKYDSNTTLNAPVTIGSNVITCFRTFSGCTNFANDIYVKGNTYRALNVVGMLSYMNTQKRKNIHFNSALQDIFYNNGSGFGITGTATTWTNMTNGFYNAAVNIYCYNNYRG